MTTQRHNDVNDASGCNDTTQRHKRNITTQQTQRINDTIEVSDINNETT